MTAEARISRLSLRVPRASGAAARMATERRLQGIDWQPPGMPPSGILLIRRLDDPLPGTFDPAGRGFGAPRAWREAVRARLGTLFETALRPVPGGAAGSAEALYFPCLADLLAWLACALAEGADGWWWPAARQSLADHGAETRGLHPAARPAALLQALPRHLPATVAVLASRGEVPALLGAMEDGEALALFRILWDVFALPRDIAGTHPPAIERVPDGTAPAAEPSRSPPGPQARAPWVEDLATRGLARTGSPAQQALIGLALALHTRPLAVRSPRFAREAAAWVRLVRGSPAPDVAPRFETWAGTVRPAPLSPGTPPEVAEAPGAPDATPSGAEPPDRYGSSATARDPDAPAEVTAASVRMSEEPTPNDQTGAERPEPERAERTGPTVPPEPRPAPPHVRQSGEPAAEIGTRSDDTVVTRLGGLLYLIHCLDDLGIPADPALNWPVERAGAWGALHGVARMLLADIGLDAEDDPIWDVFDALEPPLPAAPFVPADIRAPATWPRQLCDDAPALRYAATTGRLRLWSEAGYLLADIGRDGTAPAAQARREAARFPGHAHLRRGSDAPLPPDVPLTDPALAQAARAVTPAVRRRLCLALGSAPDDTRALRDLVHVTATLCLGASHIDMIARLDQIALPVRRAGLDRDPGWRPDLGRVLKFHFR